MKRKNLGFTLVELAVVLVVIGIILAGIMKGRDLVKSAQVKKFTQGFAQEWVSIAAAYYDKTSRHYFDGVDNGGTAASTDGKMDSDLVEAMTNSQRGDALQALHDVGIMPCDLIKSNMDDGSGSVTCPNNYNIWKTIVDGETTGPSNVRVGFANFQIDPAGININRNAVFFQNVPLDVAVGLDTMIDGTSDGENGRVRCCGTTDCPVLARPQTTEQSAAVCPITGGGTFNMGAIQYPPESVGTPFLTIFIILDL